MIDYLIAVSALTLQGDGIAPPSFSTCKLPQASSVTEKIEDLPKPIQGQITTMLPNLASRGAKFQEGDVVADSSLPRRRFVGALHHENYWVVSYEHNQGNVYHIHTVTFIGNGEDNYTVIPHGNLTGPLCAAVNAALSGVRSSDPGHF